MQRTYEPREEGGLTPPEDLDGAETPEDGVSEGETETEEAPVLGETEEETAEETEPDPPPEEAGGTPAEVPPEEEDEEEEAEKVYRIAESKFREIKQKAHDKGFKAGEEAAMATVEEIAKKAGFASVEEAFQAIKKGAPVPAKPKPKPSESQGRGQIADDLATSRERLRRKLDLERSMRKQAEAKAEAERVRGEIRVAAVRAGAVDVDYLETLVARHVSGLSEKDLASFSEAEYIAGLKKERPRLFSEDGIEEVTTGAPGGGGGGPAPEDVSGRGGGKVDASTMSREDFARYLKSKGLTVPGRGVPSR